MMRSGMERQHDLAHTARASRSRQQAPVPNTAEVNLPIAAFWGVPVAKAITLSDRIVTLNEVKGTMPAWAPSLRSG